MILSRRSWSDHSNIRCLSKQVITLSVILRNNLVILRGNVEAYRNGNTCHDLQCNYVRRERSKHEKLFQDSEAD